MPTFTESRVRSRAREATTRTAAHVALEANTRSFTVYKTYDVFLSHSIRDAELVLGVKLLLEDKGLSVYVDWIEDAKLDRSKVNAATADVLRERMRRCRSLIYVQSGNSGDSKWMPWELGYFDGFNGAVAILPVTQTEQQDFQGQEYLGLYPHVEEAMAGFSVGKPLKLKRAMGDTRDWSSWLSRPREFAKTR